MELSGWWNFLPLEFSVIPCLFILSFFLLSRCLPKFHVLYVCSSGSCSRPPCITFNFYSDSLIEPIILCTLLHVLSAFSITFAFRSLFLFYARRLARTSPKEQLPKNTLVSLYLVRYNRSVRFSFISYN